MAVWREQGCFSAILYSGSMDCTSYGSLSLYTGSSSDPPTDEQVRARRAYEIASKRGTLVWRDGVLRWRASLCLGGSYEVVELGAATGDLEADYAKHKRQVRVDMAVIKPPGYSDLAFGA